MKRPFKAWCDFRVLSSPNRWKSRWKNFKMTKRLDFPLIWMVKYVLVSVSVVLCRFSIFRPLKIPKEYIFLVVCHEKWNLVFCFFFVFVFLSLKFVGAIKWHFPQRLSFSFLSKMFIFIDFVDFGKLRKKYGKKKFYKKFMKKRWFFFFCFLTCPKKTKMLFFVRGKMKISKSLENLVSRSKMITLRHLQNPRKKIIKKIK